MPGPYTGVDGVDYFVPRHAAEQLDWDPSDHAKLNRHFADVAQRDPAVVESVVTRLPRSTTGPRPSWVIPAAKVRARRAEQADASGDRSQDAGASGGGGGWKDAVHEAEPGQGVSGSGSQQEREDFGFPRRIETQLERIEAALRELTERLGDRQQESRPATDEAFSAAIGAQEVAQQLSINEQRRLRAEQMALEARKAQLAAQEDRLRIEQAQREALLAQIRALYFVDPISRASSEPRGSTLDSTHDAAS